MNGDFLKVEVAWFYQLDNAGAKEFKDLYMNSKTLKLILEATGSQCKL